MLLVIIYERFLYHGSSVYKLYFIFYLFSNDVRWHIFFLIISNTQVYCFGFVHVCIRKAREKYLWKLVANNKTILI